MLRKTLSLMTALTLSPVLLDDLVSPDTRRFAMCILYPNQSNVRGFVSFSQEKIKEPTKIACMVKGLNPNSKHGMHIHQFGDLTDGCTSAGAHYNPLGLPHGGPSSDRRHLGDLGNLESDAKGESNVCFTDKFVSLFGDYSVLGRSVVVHAKEDDLGKTDHSDSLSTGNSGPRVACGVIGLSKEFRSVTPESWGQKIMNYAEEKKDVIMDKLHEGKEKIKHMADDKKQEVADKLKQGKEKLNQNKERIRNYAQEKKQEASEKLKDSKEKLRETKEKIKSQAQEKAEKLKQAKDKAKNYAEDKKQGIIDKLREGKEKVKEKVQKLFEDDKDKLDPKLQERQMTKEGQIIRPKVQITTKTDLDGWTQSKSQEFPRP